MVSIHTHDSNSIEKKAGKKITDLVRGKKETLLLVSGGSVLSVVEHIDSVVLGPHLTVCVLDERYAVSDRINNYLQLARTNFYERACDRGVNFFNTSILDDESSEELAERFNSFLAEWLEGNKAGETIGVFGVGADGHTAGIEAGLPHELFSDYFENADLVVSYDAETLEWSSRITTTITLMRKLRHSVVFAKGEAKRNALTALLTPGGSFSEIPARLLQTLADVHLFTDQKGLA